ncbi:unnamed protein product [Mytilus edulis]|uniref:Fibrinogen C-terminal domain-containing protein n=1 Tax=Mytilus edulis TaxID=6550 RepID=A0A8S3RZA2_MYTED|nr:unnamed protein product [Mytilus edulis]
MNECAFHFSFKLCTHGYTNILGRRSSLGVHQECESCCSGTAMCNHDLQCDHLKQKTINSTCSTINECIGSLVCLSGVCQCPSDEYYWSINTCLEKKTYNSTCVSSDECLGALYCNRGQCKCDRADYWSGSQCSQRDSMDQVDDNVKANGKLFSTKDRDNDNDSSGNCAASYKSAWWFSNCYYSDFNRVYNGNNGQMYWAQWTANIFKSILMIMTDIIIKERYKRTLTYKFE